MTRVGIVSLHCTSQLVCKHRETNVECDWVQVEVRLGQEDGLGTNRIVHWCGAQLQVLPVYTYF